MLLLIAFCVAFVIQIFFYVFLFRKYSSYRPYIDKEELPLVSIVICAKNEAPNLKELFPSLLGQHYPGFEIVLVDDGSTDDTLKEMQLFQQSHSIEKLKITVVQVAASDSQGKKSALSQGISASSHDYILLTDADCKAVSENWISEMVSRYSKNIDVVLGYGAYDKIDHSFLNKLIRFETLLTAIQYFSYALAGNAYMGVGRNLSYKKETFIRTRGFSEHIHLRSGDDDLFVSQVSNGHNVAICDHEPSFTTSKPPLTLVSWIRQKRRHITTAPKYRQSIKLSLGVFYLSQFAFYTLGIFALISHSYISIVIPLILIRFIMWYMTLSSAAIRLNEKDLIAFGPLYEISIIFMQLYIFLKNIISTPKYW